MLYHVILGLMRDGRQRHGYELVIEYRTRSGLGASAGNFYRELGRLVAGRRIEATANPPGADPRRLPYRITDRGCRDFDRWLETALTQTEEFQSWSLFIDRVAPAARERLLDRRQDALWVRSKTLARSLEEADAQCAPGGPWDPRRPMLEQQLRILTAELEFLEHFRETFRRWEAGRLPSGGGNADAGGGQGEPIPRATRGMRP